MINYNEMNAYLQHFKAVGPISSRWSEICGFNPGRLRNISCITRAYMHELWHRPTSKLLTGRKAEFLKFNMWKEV